MIQKKDKMDEREKKGEIMKFEKEKEILCIKT